MMIALMMIASIRLRHPLETVRIHQMDRLLSKLTPFLLILQRTTRVFFMLHDFESFNDQQRL